MNKRKYTIFIINLITIMLYGMLAGMTIMERKIIWFCINIVISIIWIIIAIYDYGKK